MTTAKMATRVISGAALISILLFTHASAELTKDASGNITFRPMEGDVINFTEDRDVYVDGKFIASCPEDEYVKEKSGKAFVKCTDGKIVIKDGNENELHINEDDVYGINADGSKDSLLSAYGNEEGDGEGYQYEMSK